MHLYIRQQCLSTVPSSLYCPPLAAFVCPGDLPLAPTIVHYCPNQEGSWGLEMAGCHSIYTPAAGSGKSASAQKRQLSAATTATALGTSAKEDQPAQAAAAPVHSGPALKQKTAHAAAAAAPRPAVFVQQPPQATAAAAAKSTAALKAQAQKSSAASSDIDAQLAASLAAEESCQIAPAVSPLASAASPHGSCPACPFPGRLRRGLGHHASWIIVMLQLYSPALSVVVALP